MIKFATRRPLPIKHSAVSTRAISWLATPLLVTLSLSATAARAQDATWRSAPVSNDFNTDANWTPATTPTGTAVFGPSNTTSLTLSTGTTIDTFRFNADAPAYSFSLNGHFLEFTGTGIVNNSANLPAFNAFGLLQFDNTATAGNAVINNTPGATTFIGSSTAGTATITNSGGGLLSFTEFSNAGSATITTNAGSRTQFSDSSDGGNARFVTNAGGSVDFSNTSGPDGINILNTGSIAGNGQYFLGGNIVHVGGNGDSTTVSGVISACGPTGAECNAASGTSGGTLFKEGAGTLTLSGANTHTGATVVSGGTLLIAGTGTLGDSTVQVQVLAGTLDLGGTTRITGGVSTFGGSIINGALNSTAGIAAYTLGGGFISASLTGAGAVTQDGGGTTLAATNTYTGGTAINSGTLEAAHASGGAIDALSSGAITISSGGALRSSVSGTLGNGLTFNGGSFGTLSAAAGTTLTLTGGLFLNPDSVTTFGSPTDTGTVLVNTTAISSSNSASVVVGGGILRAGSFQFGGALGTIQSTTVSAGATLDLNDFSAAIHNLGGGGSVVTGTLANTSLSLTVDPATSSEFSGVISGAGKVTVTGGGTMVLSGANTYGNGTSIMAGTTLQLGNGGVAGSIVGNVLDGGTLVFNRSNTMTFTGQISDFSGDGPASAGSLVQKGTGTTILTANNTYTAGTTINAGTLQLGNGGTTGSIVGNVLNNGTFAINRSDAVAFGGVISGTGALQQIGTGTTTLSAVETYQGSTTISAGVLALTGSASIAASSGVMANAKFDISGLSGGTSITNLSGNSAGTVALGNNTLTLTNAAGTFAGVISGSGGLVKQGSGLFTLSGANDYTGATTVAGGNLRVNGSVAGAVDVQSGATLSGIGSVGGLVTIRPGGTLSAGQSPGTITLGALNLNAGSTSIFELGSPGVVGGATNDLVNVTGNLTLGGTLSVNAPSAGYYRLFNYGTLTPSNFATVTGSTNGTPTVLTNVPNQVNLSIAAAGQRIQFWDGADQAGNGVVNGGTGTWNATNTNWTGAPGQATINDQWRSSVGVFAGTAGTVTIAGAQAFDTLQFSTTGYVLNAGAGGQLQLAGTGTGTINTDNGVAATINAPIVNGSSQSLTKVGGGTLILTAANTYSGGTTISGGTLQLGNGGASGSIVGNIVDNGTLTVNRSNALVLDGVISGTGGLRLIGTGSTTLTAANTYTGQTFVGSTLNLAAGAGITSNVVVSGGTFNNSGAVTGAVQNIGTFNNNAGGTVSGLLNNSGTAINNGQLNGGATTTFLLTNNNLIAGDVTIDLGTMTNNGAITGGVTNGSIFRNNAAGTVSGLLTQTRDFAETINAGVLSGGAHVFNGVLTNNNLVTVVDVYFSGTVQNNGTILGAATSAATFNNSGTVAGLFTATVRGTNGNIGNLNGGVDIGAGTTLNTSGTILNGVTNAGTINASGGVINGAIANNAGGMFSVTGTVTSDNTFTNAQSATLAIGTGGAYTLQGLLTNSGAVTVASGATLDASAGGVTNDAGGTITNSGVWAGNVVSNAGTINNNLTWTGTVSNAGTFNNNAGGTVSGQLTNTAGTTTNAGQLNGGASVAGGTLTNNNLISGAVGISGGAVNNNATITGTVTNAATFNNNAGGTVSGQLTNTAGTTTNAGQLNGGASVSGGTLTNNNLISGAVAISGGAVNNSATITGTVSNAAVFNNTAGGTVSGQLTNTAGTTTNAGQLNGGASVSGGTLTNNNLISGAVGISGGAVNNNAVITGTVANAATFNNNAAGTVSGLLMNSAGATTNTGQLNGGASVSGGTLTNNNLISGAVAISGGAVNNNATITGTVANAATFNNNAGGTVSGLLTNTAGTTTNAGQFNGGASVSGGTLTNNNLISGAVGISGGAVNNNATITGTVTNAATFNNNVGGTVSGPLTNSAGTTANAGQLNGGANVTGGTLTNNNLISGAVGISGGAVNNNATITGTVTNAATFNNNAGGTVSGQLTNTAGTTANAGQLNGGANVTGGTLTNNSLISGAVGISGGAVNNNATITGTVANAAVFNSNAGGTVSGQLTNTAGTTANAGQLNGGASVSGGTLTNNNLISGAVGISGGAVNNNATITGTVANAAVFNNNAGGTVSGQLNNTAGTTANAGQLNGGASVAGGVLTNNGLISGVVAISGGAVNNNATITRTVANAATFNNNVGGAVSGLLTNTAGTTTNAGQLNGGASVSGGTLTNNNLISGAVGISGGAVNNNATITGTVANAATFNNNAGGTVSGQLTNTAGTTTNAGQLNGGAGITGGTLTTTGTIAGGLTNSATVNASGTVNGPIANNAGTFTTTGTLSSNSSFGNASGATLAVGTATWTLQGLLTNNGALTVAAGATLDASAGGITNTASGTISVAAGGTVKDDLDNAGVISNAGAYLANVASNTGAGNITNAATGMWSGNVLSNAATITNSGLWTGNVVSNTGTITNNLTWTGTVANAGTFNNNAGATVSGLLTNTAGTTTNNGALNGGANIGGGAFTGSGTVTNLAVSGGIFAPGNGTPGSSMTVSGDLALQSGAMYLVALNPATATFANVGGTASLNGTAAAVYLAGNYISKKYTILTAAGGVSGTFGSLVNSNVPANFTSSLSYDASHAYIDLALAFVPNPAPNFGGGLTLNQQNVANTLVNFFNSSGGVPLAFASLTPAGLTQASGKLGTGIVQTAIKADDMFLNLLLDPSIAGRAGGFASGVPAAAQFADDETMAYAAKRNASPAERAAYAMATKAPYLAPQPVSRWSVWGAAYGGAAKVDGNAFVGSHDLTTRVWGVVGGADYKLTPDALVGFALAGGGTNYSLSDALGTGRSDMFQAGVFGRQNIGAAYLSAALAYGWHDVTTNRTVALPAGDVLQARFRAETFSGRFEGGYRFATPYAGITPYVAAQAISFSLPAYAEQVLGGAGTFALNYTGQTTTATRTELGLRSDRSFAMQDGIFTLRGRAAWAHDYNPDRAVTAVFQTLPGAAFVVNGAGANPDAALVSAGAEMKWLNGFSLAATFEGEFSGNSTSYAGKGVAKYSW